MMASSKQHLTTKRWLVAWLVLCLLFMPVLPYAAMLSVDQANPHDHHAMHSADDMPCHTQHQQQAEECVHCDTDGMMLDCQCLDHLTSSQINSTLDYSLFAYFAFADQPEEMTTPLPNSPLYPKDKPPRIFSFHAFA